ncbi:hypothetical protein [Reyranella sp.]|uniref:hypothetical protein n=1 Tax=Reyranella sp. TaxID=1929291 RepID=UPI00121043B5|nr:hypothetical protein [Reyranella sp.]TAJ83870.1 MAG: hypothetical protein EPO50_20015 [Reyranella sp.]
MVDAVVVETHPVPMRSTVSWPAIIAGGFVAAALTLMLLALGAGLGFSVVSPWSGPPDISTTTAATVGGIYMAVTAVLSSAIGGYITGRLRTGWAQAPLDEVYFRDTAHGVVCWAFATVMGAALLASAATVVSGGIASRSNQNGASQSIADPTASILDRLFRPDYGALAGGTGQRAAGVFAGGRDLAADRDVARRILLTFDQRGRTEFTGDDRQYLAQMVAARTGLEPAAAEQRVSAIEAEVRVKADAARRAAAHLSFWLVASLLMGAVAAGLTAAEGGAARDGRS